MKSQWSNQTEFKKYLDARDDFSQGRYKLAIDKLLPLDAINKNDDVNHLLVNCLYRQKSYRDAEQILLADVNSYTSDRLLMDLMIKVLLKNHEFIICREIVTSFNDQRLRRRYLQKIARYENQFLQKEPNLVRQMAKSFYHLSNGSLIRQRIVFRESQQLPLRPYFKVAKALLIDPFLVPIMRLSILDTIRKLGVKARLRYRWIDHHVYMINVDNLKDLTETWSYRQVMKIIESRYCHDPSRMLALKQTLRLDLSYLYPFNDQKIQSPGLWIKIAAIRIKGEQPLFKNKRIKLIYYLQVKLDRFTKNLVK